MTDYDELIKALRYCEFGWSARTCDNCEYSKTDCQLLLSDAADAIEELQKTIQDMTTRIECSPISGKAFDRAIEAWNKKAKMEVQDGQ